jgi:pimeloyl-ACP methyl ester carboxylesterase
MGGLLMLVEKSFDTGEVVLNYAEGPDNGPPLVMLHGTTGRWQNQLPLINHFLSRWHIYAPDFRGHGLSGRTPNKYGLRYMYNDTVKFISQVVKEPAHIFGHSLGGRIAIIVAANNPYITKSIMVAFDMKSTGLGDRMTRLGEILENKKTFDEMKEAFVDRWGDNPVELWTRVRNYVALDPEFPRSIADRVDDPDDEESYVYGYKPLELMEKISCPVLLLQAETGMMKDEGVKKALGILSKGYHVKLDGFSHALHHEEVAPVHRVLNSFLESIR